MCPTLEFSVTTFKFLQNFLIPRIFQAKVLVGLSVMRGRLVYFATWYLVRMCMRYVLPQNEYSWAYTKLLYYNTAEWLYQAGTVSSRCIVDRYVSCSYRKGRSMPPAEHALFRDRTRNAFVFFVCFCLFFVVLFSCHKNSLRGTHPLSRHEQPAVQIYGDGTGGSFAFIVRLQHAFFVFLPWALHSGWSLSCDHGVDNASYL